MALAPSTPAVTDLGAFASLKVSARANDPSAVRKAAQQFEALFTQQLLKSARAANLGDDVLGGGQTEFYQDMFDQQMSLHLSSGKGMGLADVLVKQMMGADAGAAEASNGGSMSTDLPRHAGYRPVTALARDLAATQGTRSSGAANGADSSSDADAFVDRIRPHATRAANALGVPAEAIIAQAALETGWGRHVPSHADGTPSYNFFGIKADASWDGARLEKSTHEHLGGRMQKVSAAFRSYDSVGAAFDDYARFLQSNPRYADALRQGDDAGGFVQGLQDAGYATDPAYADKLLKLVGGATISRAGNATRDPAA